MSDTSHLERLACELESSPDHRVLRRLQPRSAVTTQLPAGARTGVILDVETTGLDHEHDAVVELAMVRFAYDQDDAVLGVVDTFQSFGDPGRPIEPEITAITGITYDMVRDCALDLEAVRSFIGRSALVVAHNAAFDRRFAERLCGEFAHKPWACSMAEPPWGEEGYEGRSLGLLAMQAGFFYDRHRALNDCMAAGAVGATAAQVGAHWAVPHAAEEPDADLTGLGAYAIRAEGAAEGQELSLVGRRVGVSARLVRGRGRRPARGGAGLPAWRAGG